MTEDSVTVFEEENDTIIPLTKKSFKDKSQVNGSEGKHSDVNELKLENLIIDNPELIPAERFYASKWIPVAKQITLEDHYPDTIGVDDIGQLYIIENKLDLVGLTSIFTYGFDEAINNFNNKKIRNYSLSSYNYLIEEAVNLDYAKGNDLELLKKWRENPKEWNN